MSNITVIFSEIPDGDYCATYNGMGDDVWCPYTHTEYANGCWIFRRENCPQDEDYNQLKCELCKRAMSGEVLNSKSE